MAGIPSALSATMQSVVQGTGGFGVVYEATWRGRRVAVKKLPQMGPDQPFTQQLYDGLLGEIQLASKFDCNR